MKEALKLALDALTYIYTETTADEDELIDQAITALRIAIDVQNMASESTYKAALAQPVQRTWESIETAPKDGTDVLVMYVHIDTQVVHNGFWIGTDDTENESDIGWWSYEHSEVSRIKLDNWMTPTHWLPLPKLKEKNT
jgi:hypothetical protein